MKTTEDGDFSRENSAIYLKGMDPKSQLLSHLSAIAWDYLNSFCGGNNGVKWCHGITDFIGKNCRFYDGDFKIYFKSESESHAFVGNTPFTSCHVYYWMNKKEHVEFLWNNADAIACVLLCFGPSKENVGRVPPVKLNNSNSWTKLINLETEHMFVYSPKKWKLKFSGIPKNYLLLSFFVDESTVKNIQQVDNYLKRQGLDIDWYSYCAENSHQQTQMYLDDVPKRSNKRWKGVLRSCDSVSLGFIDLEVSEKQEGNIHSCIQDAFINAGFLFGKDISKQSYKEVPSK